MTVNVARAGVSLKNVSLPTEHGGWGFLLEPVALGLLLAPSWAGVWLCLAAVGAFLTRHPLTLALSDLRRGRTCPRTRVAGEVAVLFASMGAISLLLAFLITEHAFWGPLAAAVPLAAVYLVQDARRKGRSLSGELTGALAMSLLAPAVALAAGWTLQAAGVAWLLLAVRGMSSILFVRLQVRRMHKAPTSSVSTVAVHVAGVALVLGLSVAAPLVALVPYFVLTAYHLGSMGQLPSSAKSLGWTEAALGALNVVLIAAGFRLAG